ncbi:helix-turn-helix domain-containing protein [Niallia sp. Sow4_A1]|uniref:helix-turn-helix domain-containing protein n=1 Tax=Niallia sp. Sow4_A1 TaxID=3438793 RepID=UPI003F999CB1|nr:helix-turn-helix domain-containing protein [Niallia sp. MER TA 168]
MSFLKIIILNCLYKMNGERTIYSILHILNGKKSSQTIQDIHIFQLTSLYQSFPMLAREQLEEVIQTLYKEKWLVQSLDNHYFINDTRKGELENLLKDNPLPNYLNGWKFHAITEPFWQRLSLFIQVASHLSGNSIRYIPVQRNPVTQLWLKETLHSIAIDRSNINKYLYKDLVKCLEEIEINPAILINRLTGLKKIGLTSDQAALEMKMDPSLYQLSFLAILHFMIERILSNKEDYSLLCYMIEDNKKNYTLTASTAKTYDLIQKGHNIEEIVHLRNLKQSTIEDHIIEVLLNVPAFPVHSLVSEEKMTRIKDSIEQSSSKSLKVIKQQLPDVSYFEIRVVMARYGDS